MALVKISLIVPLNWKDLVPTKTFLPIYVTELSGGSAV